MTVTFASRNGRRLSVRVEQSWFANHAIVKKEAKGFTVEFTSPARRMRRSIG